MSSVEQANSRQNTAAARCLLLSNRPTSFPGSLSEKRETLVADGHVPPRIWVVTKNSLKGGRFRLLLSILSLQESVKCCHQNKHFFHVAPVCCITVMSQCNTVQTPKKICTVDKILLRNNPPCGFGLSPRSRDQPQPGSLFSRSWGRGERDPGNEVGCCPRNNGPQSS